MEYSDIKAINWSTLKHMHTSPRYYQWRMTNPEPPKTSYLVGSAIHCRVLESEHFASRYALCDVRRDARTAKYQEWVSDHPGAEPLTAGEWDQVASVSDAVLAHPYASHLLAQCRTEESVQWTDRVTGYLCKGRVDAIGPSWLLDLKTARTIAPGKFARHSAEYLYHGQLAWYHDGAVLARKIDGARNPYMIAVETAPPYDVAVFEFDSVLLDAGRALYRQLISRLRVCIDTDTWPGAVPDVLPLDLPHWAAGAQLTEGF